MNETTIFQTLKDKNNDKEIHQHGPYFCSLKDESGKLKEGIREPWLGEGYYFWDSRMGDAKWWGEVCYGDRGYVIYQTTYDQHSDFLFDAFGNLKALDLLNSVAALLKKKLRLNKVTFAVVLDYLDGHADFKKKYKAIRVWPQSVHSIANPQIYFPTFKFCIGSIDKVQICFFDSTLFLQPFTKVYPNPQLDLGCV